MGIPVWDGPGNSVNGGGMTQRFSDLPPVAPTGHYGVIPTWRFDAT